MVTLSRQDLLDVCSAAGLPLSRTSYTGPTSTSARGMEAYVNDKGVGTVSFNEGDTVPLGSIEQAREQALCTALERLQKKYGKSKVARRSQGRGHPPVIEVRP